MKKRYNKGEELTNLGMTLSATLMSHFERIASVPGAKFEKKQKAKRPAV